VAYALPQRQLLRRVTLDQGSCVGDALAASGLLEEFPEIGTAPLGIFGTRVQPGVVLRDRDRVEIYRPLLADPKEIRRRRAATRRGNR
jgi:putative ubiquitin-RnfH superfamily antitoxin RatB of RatAB toxin-antitoxin module